MVETTGGFTSAGLAREAEALVLPSLTHEQAIEIGEIGFAKANARALPVTVEVRLGEWTVFKAVLPGAKPEQDSWVARKARVVMATGNSTIFERVAAEERGVDWYAETGLSEELHAIHGGGLALKLSIKDGSGNNPAKTDCATVRNKVPSLRPVRGIGNCQGG